ncbi:MAG TPA: YdeI/OmpD-associated family protein [Candidatus Dormibacteraeota bacterium]|nr:YdeI/OmpD-associated family protein [Candidatus Dormibacteraeota bacterium]
MDELLVKDVTAWRKWLRANHAQWDGVWVVLAKKGTTTPTRLTYDEALEEALCHGWIDGQARGRDATTRLQRWTPRRKRSKWSKRNMEIAERLVKERRMQPAGLAEMERAKADGRWAAAYAGPGTIDVPDDLVAALAKRPRAKAMFQVLSSRNRYAVLYRIHDAKRPETRARRIQQFVEMLANGETVYPQKRPG